MSVKRRNVYIDDLIIPKYVDTFDSKEMHKIFTSGRAGTKSSRGAIRAIYKIVSDDNCSVIVMRKFHNKLKKTIYNECLRAITRLQLNKNLFKITVSPMKITYKPNGNSIYFTGNDSIDDTKGIIDDMGKPIKLVQLDELTEFFDKGDGEDEILNIIATFVRGNEDEFTMEYYFNPPKNPKAPINEWTAKMEQRSDCIHVHTDYRDVPKGWLGAKLIQEANELANADEKLYRWLWLGESIGIDELIYYMFDESKHVKHDRDFSDISFIGIGCDYGQKNATTFQAYGVDFVNRKLRGIDEYYHSGRDTGKQKSPSIYANDFKDFVERIEEETKKPVNFVFIDPSAKGLAEEIKRVCPKIKVCDAENSVELGISRVQKIMSLDVLELSDKQKNQIEELYQYKYDEDSIERGVEKPVKEYDHACDATRYLVMGVWRYLKQMLPNL